MSKFDRDKSTYAFVKIYGEYGYGHMEADIYNMTSIWSGPQLAVTSQIGTSYDEPLPGEEIYGEKFGVRQGYDVLSLSEMEAIIKALRKVWKRLESLSYDLGSPRGFQEYLFRVLIACDLDFVIVNSNYGGGYTCQLEDLPRIDMSLSWAKNDLRRAIDKMASEMIERFYPDRKVA